MTAGAAAAITAARTAAVVESDSAAGACAAPGPERGCQGRRERLPGAGAAFAAGQRDSGELGGTHAATPARPGVAGGDNQGEPVVADDPAAQPRGGRGPSVNPMSALPSVTWVMTASVLAAVSTISGAGPACWAAVQKDASQAGQQLLGDRHAGTDPQPAAPVLPQRGDAGVQPGRDIQ